ncbi:hypothetical protein GCM10027570_10820 [Streptomonospora sediminis]
MSAETALWTQGSAAWPSAEHRLTTPLASVASLLALDGGVFHVDRADRHLLWTTGGRARIVLPDIDPGSLLCSVGDRLYAGRPGDGQAVAFGTREGIATCPVESDHRYPAAALLARMAAAAPEQIQVRVRYRGVSAEAAVPAGDYGRLLHEAARLPDAAGTAVEPVLVLQLRTGAHPEQPEQDGQPGREPGRYPHPPGAHVTARQVPWPLRRRHGMPCEVPA